MEQINITDTIISTINTIFEKIFSSIDNNLYAVLDDITFITPHILKDGYMEKIFGTSTTNGVLLISNSLLIAFVIYFSAKQMLSNITYTQVEQPGQFIFKIVLCGICMNCSYFLIEQVLSIFSNITLAIRALGEDVFGKSICFSELINTINNKISVNTNSLDIFSVDGLIKGTLTISLLSLVFSYSLRYITIKIFIILSPFAILSLSLRASSFFFKAWIKNLFSLLFVQIIVSIVLLILFSMDYSEDNLLTKFLYIGGIYALIRVNTFVREFVGGVSTNVGVNVSNLLKKQ